VRAQRSIRRADVVLMLFDSQETISQVDKKLVQDILDGKDIPREQATGITQK